MFLSKFSWMKYFQQSLHLQILIGLSGIAFLFLTFYTASFLSSIPLKNETLAKKTTPALVSSDFVHVLITTDRDGIVGAVALANSILLNTRSPVYFYFITDEETATELLSWIENLHLEKMHYMIKVFDPKQFITDEALEAVTSSAESKLRFALFYIPKLLPQVKGTLICLSHDAIVQGDIAELANIAIAKNHYGALSMNCDTLTNVYHKDQNRYVHYINMNNPAVKETSVDGNQCVFDIGVMVLNMTLWEKEDVTNKLTHWFQLNQREKIFLKESFLSSFLMVFYSRTSPLSRSWHVRNLGVTKGSHYSMDYLQKAKLLQWNGHFKPWMHKTAVSHLWARYALSRPKNKTA